LIIVLADMESLTTKLNNGKSTHKGNKYGQLKTTVLANKDSVLSNKLKYIDAAGCVIA